MVALHAPNVTPCSGQASTVMSSTWKHMLFARDLADKHMPYAPRKIIALSEHMQTGIRAGRECKHMHQESNCSQPGMWYGRAYAAYAFQSAYEAGAMNMSMCPRCVRPGRVISKVKSAGEFLGLRSLPPRDR
jgi:hypothetical protein